MDVVNDMRKGSPAMNSLEGSLTSTAEKNSLKKQKRARKKKQGNDAEHKDEGLDSPLKSCSMEADVSIRDPSLNNGGQLREGLKGSLTSLAEKNAEKRRKRARRQKHGNYAENKDEGLDTSLKNCSMEADASIRDPSLNNGGKLTEGLKGSLTSLAEKNAEKKRKRNRRQKHGNYAENKDEGPDTSLKSCSMDSDASIRDPSLNNGGKLTEGLKGSLTSLAEKNAEKKRKRNRRQKHGNYAENKDEGPDTSLKSCSMDSDASITDPSLNSGGKFTEGLEGSLTSLAEKNAEKRRKRSRKQKHGNYAENKDEGPDTSLKNCSMEADASIRDPSLNSGGKLTEGLEGSLTSLAEKNAEKRRKRARKQKHGNDAEYKDEGPDTSLKSCSIEADASIRDPSLNSGGKLKEGLEGSLTSLTEKNAEKRRKRTRKKKQGNDAEHKDEGPDTSLKSCSIEADASIRDPSHESQSLPNLLSSQRSVEFDSTVKNLESERKKRTKKKTKYNATDSDTGESCVEADICHGENNEKEQSIPIKATENSKRQCDALEVSCYCNSVIANAEISAKEHVLEVVKFNLEQAVNDNSSKPEEKSGFVENASMVMKHDEDQASNHISDKFQVGKTYTRRKIVNYGRSHGHPSPENSNEETTVKDHPQDDGSHKFFDGPLTVYARRKTVNSNYGRSSGSLSPEICVREPTVDDDSHKFSDGQLTVGLMEMETKLSREVSSDNGAADEEMKLMTEKTSENRVMTTSSVLDIPTVLLEEKKGRQLGHTETTSNDQHCAGDVSDSNLFTVKDGHSNISKFSLGRAIANNSKNKLLILDINGLLADFVAPDCSRYQPEPDFFLRTKKVYKRPFCDDFLQFCFDRFQVGVWSSRAKGNVDLAIKLLMGESASKLLFCWNQSQCTRTKFTTVENRDKPLILKDLRQLWDKVNPNLPWKKGEFNESNTLLLDDSPYKALLNPMHTGVFPYSYRFHHTRDSSLGPGGDIRVYLEGLAMAENVQEYVSSHPFGQRPIREANPSWKYYQKVIEAVRGSQDSSEVKGKPRRSGS